MPLALYNTTSRKKELFELPNGIDKVRLYCCGPTVYHYAHIGNFRAYLFEDFLRRTLEYHDLPVNHVVNITDVGHLTDDGDHGEDKMEKGAARTGQTVWEVAKFFEAEFKKDWERLNLTAPSTWCRATEHIQQQIKLVQTLESKGYTYVTSDGVYFDSQKFERYADFANLDIDGLQEGNRIDIGEKKFRTDFALWKFSPTDTKRGMEWESPWGIGFPGWHIECSAMAMHYLGETLDIHCGGSDHVRIHHTNEVAQSECATGKEFSRFWMHVEFLRMGDDGKMSKSKGEILTLDTLIDKGYHPLDYRYFALNAHYRKFLNFSWEAMDAAKISRASLHRRAYDAAQQAKVIESKKAIQWQLDFKTAVGDDLNLPLGLGILHQILKDEDLSTAERGALVIDFDQVLGLQLTREYQKIVLHPTIDTDLVEKMIQDRNDARANKDFAKSDEIRDHLAGQGILIKDSPEGTTWELK